jgi:hypothetical protein
MSRTKPQLKYGTSWDKFIISSSFVLRKHVKPLVPAAFAVVSTHRVVGYGLFSLCVIYKEGLGLSSVDINRLMMMMMMMTIYIDV